MDQLYPHFGQDTLLDLPLYDIIDELDVREQLFKHHTLGHFTLGALWCGANATPQYWYNPAEYARLRREIAEARSVREREIDEERAKHAAELEAARIERLEQLSRIYRREEIFGAAVRAKAERERWHAERERERAKLAAAEERKKRATWVREELARVDSEAEAKRQADIEHEKKRKWALHTSKMERRITMIVDTIDAGSRDRELMRAMLRYQNLGPGIGVDWDAEEFTSYYGSWRSSLRDMTRIDVDRCYLMLKYRHRLMYARRADRMPITITGDMTQEQVDDAMVANLRELIASAQPGGTVPISQRQAQHLLDMIEAGKDKDKEPKADK